MPTRNQEHLVSTKSQISSVFTDNLVLQGRERIFATLNGELKNTNQNSYRDQNLIIQEWKGYKKYISLQTFAKIYT